MEDAKRKMLAAGCKVGPSTPLVAGSVKNFDPVKRYGFIVADGGGKDHFVHVNHLLDGNALAVGARVVFVPANNPQKGPQNGKPMATLVTGAYSDPNRPGGAAVEARNAARSAPDVSARHLIGESAAHVEKGAGRSTPSGEERARAKRERERAERRAREEVDPWVTPPPLTLGSRPSLSRAIESPRRACSSPLLWGPRQWSATSPGQNLLSTPSAGRLGVWCAPKVDLSITRWTPCDAALARHV